MNSKSIRFDWALIIPIVFLLLLSLTVIGSLVPQLLFYQLAFCVVSILVFIFISQIDYKIFQSLHWPIYIGSLVFLLLPFVFGLASRGAHRWLQFGSISVQPSELIKPFLITSFALIAANTEKHKVLKLLGIFLPPAAIIFMQPDLGTMLVLSVAWGVILISQLPARVVLGFGLLLLVLSPLSWFALRDYQKDRLITFVNPYHDPLGRGYHVIQSMIAVGSGQLVGRGLGQGTQSSLRFLPESHTDFVFASMAEDLGFVGSGLSVVLLTLLLYRLYVIHKTTPDSPAALFCLATFSMIAFQSFVNIGMNMGIVPVTGITLPFMSYGGSSLLSLGITMGVVNSISCQIKNKNLL